MSALNKAIIIGHLGADPILKYSANNDAIATISVAVTETWVDKTTNQKKEATEWLRVVFYRKLAEIVGQYLKKGSAVYVEGKIKTRKYKDKDGTEKQITEIIADNMQMLGSGPKQESAAPRSNAPISAPVKATQTAAYVNDEDIPF